MATKEQELTDDQMVNYLTHNGILQELNRTVLHPIGLDMRLDMGKIKMFKTSEKEGYLLDRINPMHTNAFRQLMQKKTTVRQRLLGFGIQVKDAFRQEAMKKVAPMFIKPERQKLTLLLDCLQIFAHSIYRRILANHKDKDLDLSLEQFDIEDLKVRLLKNIYSNDPVDVAAIAMMIDQNDLIIKGMKEIQVKAKEYESKMKQIQEEREGFSMDELERK